MTRFPDHGLYCITDLHLAKGRSHAEQARLCLDGGARIIQLRDKETPYAALLPQACEVAALCRERGAVFIVNDDPRLAVESGADGVHVGQSDTPVEEARRLVGPGRIVGLSTHTREELAAAQSLPADYLGFGPVFATTTKAMSHPPHGAAEAGWAIRRSALPIVPIGGITLENLPSLVAEGARYAAVVSAVVAAGDIAAAARVLAALLK